MEERYGGARLAVADFQSATGNFLCGMSNYSLTLPDKRLTMGSVGSKSHIVSCSRIIR